MTPITCRKCGRVIAESIEIGGLDFLCLGGMLLRVAHGVHMDHECNEPFHYTMNDNALARILRQQLKTNRDEHP